MEEERVRGVENVIRNNNIRLYMNDFNRETVGLPGLACSCPTVGQQCHIVVQCSAV